ncbi:MAG: CPBP family intramembrane glutamic endopeptidase [Candidatus Omnitrophota bacterium]
MLSKRNLYLIATILCLTGIITLQSIITAKALPDPGINFSLNQQQLLKSPHLKLISFFLMLYAGLIVTGVIMLAVAAVKKFHGMPAINRQEAQKMLPLAEEQSSKLFFLASFLLLTLELTIVLISRADIRINPIGLLLTANGLMELGTILLVVAFLSVRWLDFKIQRQNLTAILSVYTATLPLLILAAFVSTLVTQTLNITRTINPAIPLFLTLKNKPMMALLAFEAAILGPVAEELFFRGFIYKFTRTRFSFLPAAIATSLFFAVLHRTPYDILPLSFISIALCYTYEKTQNIISPIIFHSLYNTLNLVLLFLLKDFIKI